jgi:hypothetical protein
MVRFQKFSQKNQKITCWTPLAANRTPNRMGIRMENRTCRQPLRYFLLKMILKGLFLVYFGLVHQENAQNLIRQPIWAFLGCFIAIFRDSG